MPSGDSSPDAALPPFDFGEFSCRSLGVTVRLPEEVGRRFPEAAASAVLAFGSTAPERVAELRRLYAERADPATRFLLAGYASAIVHELRHFHDYLATPFGASTMADLALAARYCLPTLAGMAREPTVGLPLQRWQSLSPALHAAYRRQTRSGTFSAAPPAALGRITASAQSILERVERRLGPSPTHPESELTTRHLLEVSALCAQIEYVELLFGYEAAVEFAKYVADYPGTALYSRLVALFNTVADDLAPGRHFSPLVMNAIVLDALCASGDPATEWSHPVDRLHGVLGYLQYAREFPDASNVLDILEHVSTTFAYPGVEESLNASVQRTHELARALRVLAERDRANGLPVDGGLVDCFDAWAAAHEFMAGAILQRPGAYLEPASYLDATTSGAFVAAPVYLAGEGPAFRTSEAIVAAFRQGGWTTVWGLGDLAERPDEVQVASLLAAPGMTAGHPLIPLDRARYLSMTLWVTSALWSSAMLSPMHRQVASAVLRSGPVEWEVLLL
jgi:hypothetical protein